MIDVHIVKQLGGFTLDARFQSDGAATALFGRSGAGKSSVVQAIAGLIRPDEGHIRVDGETYFDAERGIDVPAERRRCGVVFQESRLFPHMSVEKNLLYGHARAAAPRRIEPRDVTTVLDINHLLRRQPAKLSGGERQRVALGRAILAQPRILLMDEPLAALDATLKGELLPYFERVGEEFAIPLLYVSHAIDEVTRIASDIVLMDGGRVIAAGSLSEITSRLDLPPEAAALGAGAVLSATIADHEPARGMTVLATAAGDLRVPLLERPRGARLSIRIPARDVSIATERPAAISVQNILPCTVEAVVPIGRSSVRLRLSCGTSHLLAEITADAGQRLSLSVGTNAFALIKSVAAGRSLDGGGDPGR